MSTHVINTDIIHNCMQVKLRDILKKIRSLPNEINMCRMCTPKVSCSSGEMVRGAAAGSQCCAIANDARKEKILLLSLTDLIYSAELQSINNMNTRIYTYT